MTFRRLWCGLMWMLDLADDRGNPDFGKFMQAGTQVSLLASIWTKNPVPFSLALALIISAHGTRVVMAAIKSGVFRLWASVLESRSESRAMSRVVTERRDPALAIEPIP